MAQVPSAILDALRSVPSIVENSMISSFLKRSGVRPNTEVRLGVPH